MNKKIKFALILKNGEEFYSLDAKKDVEFTKLRFVGVDTKGDYQDNTTKIKLLFNFSKDDQDIDKEEFIKNFVESYKNRFSDILISVDMETDEDSEKKIFEKRLPKVAAQGFDTSKKGEENSVEVVQDKLIRYMDAGFPLIYINTFEEDKVDDIIEEAASERTLFEWNAEEFFGKRKGHSPEKISKEGWSLKDSLKHLIRIQEVNQSQKNSPEEKIYLKYDLERS